MLFFLGTPFSNNPIFKMMKISCTKRALGILKNSINFWESLLVKDDVSIYIKLIISMCFAQST